MISYDGMMTRQLTVPPLVFGPFVLSITFFSLSTSGEPYFFSASNCNACSNCLYEILLSVALWTQNKRHIRHPLRQKRFPIKSIIFLNLRSVTKGIICWLMSLTTRNAVSMEQVETELWRFNFPGCKLKRGYSLLQQLAGILPVKG